MDDELECVQRLAKERSFRLLVLPGHALDDISSPTKASLAEDGTGSGRSFASLAGVRAYLEGLPANPQT